MNNYKNTNPGNQWRQKAILTAVRMDAVHPAVQIYIWAAVSMVAQWLSRYELLAFAGIVLLCTFIICANQFLSLIRRTRWILFSVFMVYAYSSQGEPVWSFMGALSPVVDGVVDGFFQMLRLVTLLASLSILLTLLNRSQLINGLYSLSRPLSLFGLNRASFAVRLALTLDYAECAIQDTAGNWRASMESLLKPVQVLPGYIELKASMFTRCDKLLVVSVSIALLGFWL